MNLDQLSEIRISIGNTIDHIRADPPEPTCTALQNHLESLLKEELRALTGQALDGESHVKLNLTLDTTDLRAELARLQARLAALKAEKHTTPWYPDDSGEWVEGHPRELPPETVMSGWLLDTEREGKNYRESNGLWHARDLTSKAIVAYKVVKP